jgi:outer membrane protein assembly factor BamB
MPALILGEMVIQGNGIDGIKAYHKKSGRLKWSKKISGGVEVGADQKGGTIFFGANDGFFYAVDVNTGKTKWTFPLRSEGIGRPRVSDNVV